MKATQLKKSISVMTILFATTSAMAAHPDDNNNGNYQDYARVKNVTPEYQRVNSPRQDCRNEYIRDSGYDGYRGDRGDRSTSDRSYTGTVVGGVAGALLGSRFGKGKGSTAATAVGAIAGAVIGDKVAANGGIFASNERDHDYRDRDHDYRGREVQRCRTVDHYENRLTGYRVVYEYAGRNYTTVMQNQPGRQIPVQVSVVPTGEAARSNTTVW